MATDEDTKLLDSKVKLFDALLRIWAHADAYLWNRARLILGVQAGVLAASYAVRGKAFVAAIILFAGALLAWRSFLWSSETSKPETGTFSISTP